MVARRRPARRRPSGRRWRTGPPGARTTSPAPMRPAACSESAAAPLRPRSRSGGQPSVSTIDAPIWRSGIATRSTGRRRIDSSPSSVNVPLLPREDADEQPQQRARRCRRRSARSGARSPRRPTPCTRSRVGPSSSCSTRAPSCSTAAIVESVSASGAEPVDLHGAVRERAEQHRAVRDRLVAGRRHLAHERARRRDAQDVVVGHAPPSPASGVAIAE